MGWLNVSRKVLLIALGPSQSSGETKETLFSEKHNMSMSTIPGLAQPLKDAQVVLNIHSFRQWCT